ncbi:MAG: Mur ligase family protein [Chitinophagales bacterium]|nr:peptidoglycan synthetase [Bacteroidota bacterium]MCB9043768.1 peptidoglycan synthetase [Chitinophagales bacterium]
MAKKIHFIAIGGSVMHQLAIDLHLKNWHVVGSDDLIFEPSHSNLQSYNLLPKKMGWFPEKITPDINIVLLGMHAHSDNPELLRALELKLKVLSFPEFIFQYTREKTRILVGGSHGKTTLTCLLFHVFQQLKISTDFLAGAIPAGYERSVILSENAPNIIIEGDEYLTSCLQPVPKLFFYKPQYALLTGIAWDHINVFPTFENYKQQFALFLDTLPSKAVVAWNAEDESLAEIVQECTADVQFVAYQTPEYVIENSQYFIVHQQQKNPVSLLGKHNMQNIAGAMALAKSMGISETSFLQAAANFTGAARRMELLYQSETQHIFRDFAHAPSKVKATLRALRELYPHKKLIACLELHTFSSLQTNFLPEYRHSLDGAEAKCVFVDAHTLIQKNKQAIPSALIHENFGASTTYVSSKEALEHFIVQHFTENSVLLLMSSGSFAGLNISEIPKFAAKNKKYK